MFTRQLVAGWGDMDFNAHMRNTAYLDKSVDMRMMFFAERGFPMSEFARLRIGPVVMKDEIEYSREVNLLDTITATLAMAGLADDGSRFLLRNEFHRPDGKLAAKVTSTGGWMDLSTRRLVAPPAKLLEALTQMPRSEDFAALPGSVR